MAKYTSINHLQFLLYNVHHLEDLFQYERFQDLDKDTVDLLINAVKDFCDQEVYPYFQEMDEKPAVYKDNTIIVHPQLKTIIEKSAELGILGGSFDYELGGAQLPHTLTTALFHILDAANNNTSCYMGLTNGSARLITSFGSQEQKETYVPNMLSGKWTGTMCLTEPQAGSSLSDITTTAYPQEDGTYLLKGQKIFISAGDQQHTENIIHLVLARIAAAPAGTKGISLFIVPKKRIAADGSLENNDVFTAGDFQKLGQKGWATAHLTFGENNNCKAWLVGTPHLGLRYMFQMMNGARIDVGATATAIATAAYYASLQYAKERPQGRRLQKGGRKDVASEQTLIINHPDVRRMLLLQKSIVEASLSLVIECSILAEMRHLTAGEESENKYLLLEILTPICKTYPSEMGQVAVTTGLQVLGGYGFCTDFPLQQYYRDIRITPLYEGTTGIQSLDLLGRKVTMKGGAAVQLLHQEIGASMEKASTFDDLKPYVHALEDKLKLHQKVLQYLMGFAMKGEQERFVSDATIYMNFLSTIVVAWQWLKMATVAKEALVVGNTEFRSDFYESKIHTMRFYFKYELPKTRAWAETLMNDEVLTIVEEKEVVF